MQYAHKKSNLIVRIIYIFLFILSVVAMSVGEGAIKTALSTFSAILMVATVYLILKYEMTTYTYIINEKDTDFDLYVNKSVGRRGTYVCYYYMSDVIEVVKYTKELKEEYSNKYKVAGIYSFFHGFASKDRYIVIFKNTDYYDMIILEMNDNFLSYFKNCIETADASCRVPEEENDNATVEATQGDESINSNENTEA